MTQDRVHGLALAIANEASATLDQMHRNVMQFVLKWILKTERFGARWALQRLRFRGLSGLAGVVDGLDGALFQRSANKIRHSRENSEMREFVMSRHFPQISESLSALRTPFRLERQNVREEIVIDELVSIRSSFLAEKANDLLQWSGKREHSSQITGRLEPHDAIFQRVMILQVSRPFGKTFVTRGAKVAFASFSPRQMVRDAMADEREEF